MKNIQFNSIVKNIINRMCFIMIMFLSTVINAQTPFPDNTEDVPGAPIDDWIIPFIVLSSICGYYLLKKKINIAKNSH